MKICIDSSVIVAGVHASHPRHALVVDWLTRMLARHERIVAHHSVLEAYAVLTRLPGDHRLTPSEARDLLNASVPRFGGRNARQRSFRARMTPGP